MDDIFSFGHRSTLTFVGIPFASKNWHSKFRFVHQIFNYVVGVLIMFSLTAFMAINSNNSTLLVETAAIWATGLIMLVSLTVCLIFRYKFRVFLEEMAFVDSMHQMPLVKCVMKANVDEKRFGKLHELKVMVVDTQAELIRYTRLILRVYLSLGMLIATLYVCDAVYQFLTRANDLDRPMAFPMWFPWCLNNLVVYTATMVYQLYAGWLCAATYPAFQCTVMFMIGQVIRQLKVLAFITLNLEELGAELAQARTRTENWQLYCTQILTQCVQHYTMLKRFGNRLNATVRYFYLGLILNAIFVVCVTSVKIAISDKTAAATIKYYIHEMGYIFIVMIPCLLGQKVENQCEDLEQVVTEKWYIFSRGHRKNVLIFKMALGQGMPIYIFGSIPLSLPTFTWFLKTGMSFFTLVMSVLEEEQ